MTRKPLPATNRFPEFRSWAREITQAANEARKYGWATDLNGQIARAMERAYQRGFEDAQTGTDSVAVQATTDPHDATPLPASMVSSKIRGALHSIGLWKFGSGYSGGETVPRPTAYMQDKYISTFSRTDPDWRILTAEGDVLDESFSNRTVQQLVKLGLLTPARSDHPSLKDKHLLRLSPKGDATYKALFGR